MSDTLLRNSLIKLAHTHPEFRKDLLPLIKSAGCEKLPEGGMRDNCEKKVEEGKKNDKEASLRSGLIKLAHSHPEFRKDLLPLITACMSEAPVMGRFEEGVPADPTKNMSEEDAKEWNRQNELNKDNFKSAKNKQAGKEYAHFVRVGTRIRILIQDDMGDHIDLHGSMQIVMPDGEKTKFLFFAEIGVDNSTPFPSYTVKEFQPKREIMGTGVMNMLSFYKGVLEDAIKTNPAKLLDISL